MYISMKVLVSIWVLCLPLAACEDNLNDSTEIRYQQVYNNEDYDFSLKVDTVLNDSRCPKNAVCVWEGDAGVLFDLVFSDSRHYKFSLHTNTTFKTDTTVENIKFTLLELQPYPMLNAIIKPEDYVVKILMEKIE